MGSPSSKRSSAPALQGLQRRFQRWAIAPSLLLLAVLAGLPLCFLFVTSLTPATLVDAGSLRDFSEPLRNGRLLLDDARFFDTLGVQARLSVYTVTLQVALGTGLALLAHGAGERWRSLRHLFVVPMVLPPIVVAVIWKLLYTPDISPIHQAAHALGWALPALTTHADFALWAIVLADTWEWAPFTFLMVLAALQDLPTEQVEAARLDGADALRLFVHIVLPYIAPVLLVCTLFRLIDSIKAFPLIFLLTSGGPGSATEVSNYYAYLLAFNNGELGYSSAVTAVLLIATALISGAVMWTRQRREGCE